MLDLRRRQFITLLGGAAAAWPLAARAQQDQRMRRISVLIQVAEGDPQARIEVAAFLRSLNELGWSEGRLMTQQLILKRASAGRPMRARRAGTIMSDRDRTDDIRARRART
jgi:putative tryptophan/tyrosine transport system substrate-binding protein